MTASRMMKASLDSAVPTVHGKIAKQSVTLDGVTATRVTFAPGARWSDELASANAPSCSAPHVAVVLSGTLRVRMDDGTVEDFGAGDVMLLPPGHDAWTVGDAPGVFVELSRGYDDYGPDGVSSDREARLMWPLVRGTRGAAPSASIDP